MWKRIRSWYSAIGGIQGGLKKVAENPIVGIALWVVFVQEITPPETTLLKSSFLVVVGMLAIRSIATPMQSSPAKPAKEENSEDSTVN